MPSKVWRISQWTYQIFTNDEVEFPEVLNDEKSPMLKLVDREQEFHDFVRQQIICMWLFMALYLVAYWLISRLKRKTEREALYAGEEDYFVYRVSVWMCSISMAVSIGSLTLLPFSVIGVELLQLYEGNYYLQWLSYSLIGSLWNYVFILSNLSLFVLLPFSYFFIESQGFSTTRNRNGITQRVYETLAICALFIVVLLCLAEIVLTIFKYPVSFLSITSVNLPLIYSCVSLIGALLLLISTPYGFAKMFSFVREFFFNDNKNSNQENCSDLSLIEKGVTVDEDEQTLVQEDNRKDSDSGIESGSMEEMRLDTEEEDEMDYDAGGDATIRKRSKKHDYAEISTVVTRTRRKKRVENVKENVEEKATKTYNYNNDNIYPSRRHRHFSESGDNSASHTVASDYEARQMQYSKYRNSEISHYYVGSPWKHTSELNLASSGQMFSPICPDLTIGSPVFASTPLGLFNMQSPMSRKLVGKRSKSEDALWKPQNCLSSMRRSVFKRAAEKIRAVLRFEENSRRGKMYRLVMSLRFPTIVAILLVLTAISLMMVAINTLKLLFGFRSLPEYAQFIEIHTRHSFGLFGACIETLIIIYVMLTSFVGLYSLPLLRTLRPVRKDTSMTAIIINSSLVLVVSSALPVIVNTLGMTTFDLLGAYSSLQWLSSFRVVLAYNLVFFIVSIAFLFNQLTASMRNEIIKRLSQLRCRIRTKQE